MLSGKSWRGSPGHARSPLSEPAIRLSGRPVELLQLKRKLYYDTGRLQARSAKHTTAESERERGPLADIVRGLVRFTEPRSRSRD